MTRKTHQATAPEAESPPPRFRLVRPYGFVDEYGQNRHWQQGEIVGDPAQLALLAERGAELAPLEDATIAVVEAK